MSFLPVAQQSITLIGQGLQSIFGAGRSIYGTFFQTFNVQVILNETTQDTLTITKHPVQTGASITDHSFMEPVTYSANILQNANFNIPGTNIGIPGVSSLSDFAGVAGSGKSALAQTYASFLKIQSARQTFTVATPKRTYKDMLMTSVRMTTDKNTENILALAFTCQQVILVNVGSTVVNPLKLASPANNAGTNNVGNVSAAGQIAQGVNPNVTLFQKPATP